MCWSFLPHVRFLILLTVFELLPKTCNFTICSIDTLVMIQTKFGFHWSSTFRGEDFWKSLRRTTDDEQTTDDDDGRQVMRIAHMTLWVRWAKKNVSMAVLTMAWGGGEGLHRQAIWVLCYLLIKLIPEKQIVLTKILAIHVVQASPLLVICVWDSPF